jgi:hypothetical protein
MFLRNPSGVKLKFPCRAKEGTCELLSMYGSAICSVIDGLKNT